MLYDALNMSFRELKLRKDPDAKPITELIDYVEFCGIPAHEDAEPLAVSEPFERITVVELASRREAGWRPYVLDVRRVHEVQIAALPFADRVHPHDVVHDIAVDLPRDRDIVISCKSGGRSVKAARALAELGFDRLFNLEGGINAWANEIDASIPTY